MCRYSLRAGLVVLPLMSLAAAFAFLSVSNADVVAFRYLFIAFTCLQSVFILIAYIILSKEVCEMLSSSILYLIFRLHQMHAVHEMQPIITNVRCLSVTQLSFTVQKWLNRSRCCLGWTLLGAPGTLCYTGVLIPHRQGEGDLHLNFGTPLVSPERLKLETWNFVCVYMAAEPIQNYAK